MMMSLSSAMYINLEPDTGRHSYDAGLVAGGSTGIVLGTAISLASGATVCVALPVIVGSAVGSAIIENAVDKYGRRWSALEDNNRNIVRGLPSSVWSIACAAALGVTPHVPPAMSTAATFALGHVIPPVVGLCCTAYIDRQVYRRAQRMWLNYQARQPIMGPYSQDRFYYDGI